MKRVVVTGLGIISSIGKNKEEVLDSLYHSKSGISYNSEYDKLGFRSRVSGSITPIDFDNIIPRKALRFMGDAGAYGYISMLEAIADAKLDEEHIQNLRTGLVMGSGGSSTQDIVEAADIVREKGIKRVGPYRVSPSMASAVSASLSTAFGIQGMNVSLSSACSTSAHCIGYASELIQWGKQDIVFAGGAEAEHWTLSVLFDAMSAMSSNFNDEPEIASRPYDVDRDGFVISGGAGVMVLEEYEHALKRGAPIYAELTGFGTASDGDNMVNPSGIGAANSIRLALNNQNIAIDYINTHGTSTPAGDIVELKAIKEVLGGNYPHFSSTKSLTGHSMGAAGVHESIFSLLMMKNDFMAASANIFNIDPYVENLPVLKERKEQKLNTVASNSYGFGGTNVTLIYQKV